MKGIQTAKEGYLTLKSFNHYGCIVVPKVLISEGLLNCYVVKCIHGNKKITIERKDI